MIFYHFSTKKFTLNTIPTVVTPLQVSCVTKIFEQIFSLVDATKSTKAHRLPEVIIIQLKRFRHTMFGSCKVGKVVEFPLRSQDFGRWTTSGEPALYDLVGFVVHEGRSLEFGHYVSYCRHEQDNQWWVAVNRK